MTRGPDTRITWIVDYLQRHLGEPVSIPELAGRVNLSESRLRALFRRQHPLCRRVSVAVDRQMKHLE